MSNILIISPEFWNSHTVSKHHYARTLSDLGHKVFFLNPPSRNLKSISNTSFNKNSLIVIDSPVIVQGLRFLPAFLRLYLEKRWLKSLESLLGLRLDTIWLFENSRFFNMRFAGDRLTIYHQVDLNQNFHPEQAAVSADVCLCTTDIIAERLRRVRPDVHKIHHGTAVVPERSVGSDTHLFDSPRVHATYIGNLDMAYLDVEALRRLVSLHSDVSFHFVGGYTEQTPLWQACQRAHNVHWWGKVPFTQVPCIVEHSDVLLVAYQKQHQRDQASPHKFMEYLLSGKVVVSSYTDEYKDKRHLVEMADPDGDLEAVFARVVVDLDYYNSAEKQAERKAFALEHRYENQLARIEKIILDTTGRKL